MAEIISEKDWNIFRELREVALDRFCRRALEDIENIRADAGRTHHERYLAIFHLLQKRDKKLGERFDNPRRSQMLWQLELICSDGLLKPDEIARFGEKTRKIIGF